MLGLFTFHFRHPGLIPSWNKDPANHVVPPELPKKKKDRKILYIKKQKDVLDVLLRLKTNKEVKNSIVFTSYKGWGR